MCWPYLREIDARKRPYVGRDSRNLSRKAHPNATHIASEKLGYYATLLNTRLVSAATSNSPRLANCPYSRKWSYGEATCAAIQTDGVCIMFFWKLPKSRRRSLSSRHAEHFYALHKMFTFVTTTAPTDFAAPAGQTKTCDERRRSAVSTYLYRAHTLRRK